MGGTPRAAGGAALLILGLAGITAASAAASSHALEAETLRGGKVVRDSRAAGGRALELRRGAVARSKGLSTGALSAVLVRARGTGKLTVQVDDAAPAVVTLTRAWREHKVAVAVVAGQHRLTLSSTAGKARVDRLRLRATRRRAATPKTTAPAPPAGEVRGAARHRVPLGSAVSLEPLRSDGAYEAAFRSQFDSLTPENELKMDRVQPERGRFEFAAPDELLAYAERHGRAMRGHTLIFGKQTPPWVRRILFADDAARALREHITTVMTHYKGRISEWEVVNEAFDDDGSYRYNAWYEKLGPSYVDMAYEIAREVDPSAKLYYNEMNAETNNRKRAAVVNLARSLKGRGLLDGIGLQLHTTIDGAPTRAALEETLGIYNAMGLETQITEMDVVARGDGSSVTLGDRLAKQAAVFRDGALACSTVPRCVRFTVWGVSDRYSWMTPEQMPLLLDSGFAEKPALAAVRAALG